MSLAVYRIQDVHSGWAEHRFRVKVHVGGVKIETSRPTRQEAEEAVCDACSLYGATKLVDMGEKGFDKPIPHPVENRPDSEREALLRMSLMALERRRGV